VKEISINTEQWYDLIDECGGASTTNTNDFELTKKRFDRARAHKGKPQDRGDKYRYNYNLLRIGHYNFSDGEQWGHPNFSAQLKDRVGDHSVPVIPKLSSRQRTFVRNVRGMVTELITTTDAEFYGNHLCDENKLEPQDNDDDDAATSDDDDDLKEPPDKKAKTDTDADDAAAKAKSLPSGHRGMFLYFQKVKGDNKEGKLRMSAPRKEKEKYRDILSEAGNVVSQLNICIDIKYQLYIVRRLHNTPHAAEDNCERERCCRILKEHGCKITEMIDYDKNGVQEIPGEAANYTSKSAILQEQVSTAFSPQCMENLAKYILGNGSGNKNRDVGDDSKRINIGFGQIQTTSEKHHGQKMPTFNAKHLRQLHPDLQVVLAKMMSFSQRRLNDFGMDLEVDNRSMYVRQKWQEFYDINTVKVDWAFEFVDINIRSEKGDLQRHCDYKNDWRQHNDGCVVFSYSVIIGTTRYRVVMVMTSRYSVGASFDKIHANKAIMSKKNSKVKKGKSTLRKQCNRMQSTERDTQYPTRMN